MPNVLIRDVPEAVHKRLQDLAEQRGQSLQQYLLGELSRLSGRPTLEEVLDRIEHRHSEGSFTFEEVVDDIRADRGERDSR